MLGHPVQTQVVREMMGAEPCGLRGKLGARDFQTGGA